MRKLKLILEEIQCPDKRFIVKNEQDYLHLIINSKDIPKMELAGLDPSKDEDLFSYANHLIGDRYDTFEMIRAQEKESKHFPNGFASWMETHFEVCQAIAILNHSMLGGGVVQKRREEQGHGGLYELSEELTDEFEKLNQGREWDGEFYEEVEKFIDSKLK